MGIPVIPIDRGRLLNWPAVRTLKRLLNDREIDLIHAHNGQTALTAALAVSLARRGRFVVTQHFLTPARAGRSGWRGAISSRVHRAVGIRAGGMIAVSEASRKEMIGRGDSTPDRITVVRNGIPEPELSGLLSREEARRTIGIDALAPLVLCAARLEPEKDVPTLVRAMSVVAAKLPDVKCLLAGDGGERDRINADIAALGLTNRITLLGFHPMVGVLMTACDLLVLPSVAEPFGLVLLEAMSHGRAVVATRAGGPLEIVEDGTTGLLVPPGDPSALAAAMIRLLLDRESCDQMGRQGFARMREEFTVARMARATARVYERTRHRTKKRPSDLSGVATKTSPEPSAEAKRTKRRRRTSRQKDSRDVVTEGLASIEPVSIGPASIETVSVGLASFAAVPAAEVSPPAFAADRPRRGTGKSPKRHRLRSRIKRHRRKRRIKRVVRLLLLGVVMAGAVYGLLKYYGQGRVLHFSPDDFRIGGD